MEELKGVISRSVLSELVASCIGTTRNSSMNLTSSSAFHASKHSSNASAVAIIIFGQVKTGPDARLSSARKHGSGWPFLCSPMLQFGFRSRCINRQSVVKTIKWFWASSAVRS
ncbi:hypothetical protein MPTK1_6g03020 [Marchantia polymorpha subsp. ruderalis]|uniref:Uncharacterized protein n=2 Tax=Marchantia polymorpha TaxID=3197 RepID=A0AAF6BMZ1_MARPO|nr:hypothetical protein MARPO_0035s0075 [Marchantia polymorpha]BBN13375.1 hypothetical protein Mp_6g03020 [Marchantia polymorpha subsp. ruderalis]|eukprot:PTQ41288.1 hypothetical protein MARPO_0035s0075 [Marchantia polymorpha]